MGRPLGGESRKFTKEEKYKMLIEHYEGNLSWKELCRKYNLSTSLVYKWDVKFSANGKDGLTSNSSI